MNSASPCSFVTSYWGGILTHPVPFQYCILKTTVSPATATSSLSLRMATEPVISSPGLYPTGSDQWFFRRMSTLLLTRTSMSMNELLTTGVVSARHPPGSSRSGSYATLNVRNPSRDSPSGSIPLLLGLSSGSPENHLTQPVPSSVIMVPMGRVLVSGLM